MSQPVTVKDIAQLAGVSIGTVDRVLHKRGRVAEKTSSRIKEIIKETGYTPNLHASNLANSKPCTIGVLTPLSKQDSGFWQLPHNGMKRAIEDLSPFPVNLSFHCYDRFSNTSFLKTVKEMGQTKVDGILLAPILPISIGEISTLLPDHVPVCCFDSDFPGLKKLSFIGQEPVVSGKLAAKLMQMLTKNSGTTTVVQAVKADYHIRGRVEGFLSRYSKRTIPKIYQEEHLEDPVVRSSFMDNLLNNEAKLQGIFIPNALGHIIAEELESRGINDIHIIGYDLIDKNVEYLKKGNIDFLISQRPELQGYRGVIRLFDAFKGKDIGEDREIMPLDILTAENVDYYTPFK